MIITSSTASQPGFRQYRRLSEPARSPRRSPAEPGRSDCLAASGGTIPKTAARHSRRPSPCEDTIDSLFRDIAAARPSTGKEWVAARRALPRPPRPKRNDADPRRPRTGSPQNPATDPDSAFGGDACALADGRPGEDLRRMRLALHRPHPQSQQALVHHGHVRQSRQGQAVLCAQDRTISSILK